MKTLPWQGVYTAITTKFTEDGEIDFHSFKSSVEVQVNAGVDAIIVGGSLGESSTLSADERIALMLSAKEAAPGIPVLVNVACSSTAQAIELVNLIEDNGADGLMVLPPLLYKATDAEVVSYFLSIAQSTSLPIMIYNNPVDYKIEVSTKMFEQLLKNDRIQSVKESTRDLANVTRLINAFGDRLKILCGVDTLALESLLLGAAGWVAGLVNAFPEETVAIFRLARAGRIDEAVNIYRWFMPLLELDINPQLVQNIKLAEAMTGIGTEPVRMPRMKLQGQERERVISIIQQALDSRPASPKDILSKSFA